MGRTGNGGARKPASKFPQLRKQMQKNLVAKGVRQTKSIPKPATRKP